MSSVDSVEWNATHADLIVVARVEEREPGELEARVALAITEVVAGRVEDDAALEVTLAGDLRHVQAGERLLLYLARDTRVQGRPLTLLDARHAWLPLDHLEARGAVTADCAVYTQVDDVLAAARGAWRAAGSRATVAPASLAHDPRVEAPGERWTQCDVDGPVTRHFGEVVVVRAPVWDPPGHAAPESMLQVLERAPTDESVFDVRVATEVMTWFHVGYLQVERASCDVGVPDHDGDPVVLNCAYPGGADDLVPEGLEGAAKRARRAVMAQARASMDAPVSQVQARYLGRGRVVELREVLPTGHLPRGPWRDGYDWTASLLLAAGEVRVLTSGGNGKPEPLCAVARRCAEPLAAWRWDVPVELRGQPVLLGLAPGDPTVWGFRSGLAAALEHAITTGQVATGTPTP